jgi:hypothetical protein
VNTGVLWEYLQGCLVYTGLYSIVQSCLPLCLNHVQLFSLTMCALISNVDILFVDHVIYYLIFCDLIHFDLITNELLSVGHVIS